MTGWGRLRGALLAAGVAAAVSGCGQLFTQGQAQQPVTLAQLASRVDSLDAQLGEVEAALASSGGAGPGSGGAQASGVVPPGLATAVVVADVLNVRSDPSLSGTIKGTLLQNARVGILGEQGNWTEITYTNPKTHVTLTGWVDSDYLGPDTGGSGQGGTATGASSGTAAGGAQAASAAAKPAGAASAATASDTLGSDTAY
jgi:hypothetical protein